MVFTKIKLRQRDMLLSKLKRISIGLTARFHMEELCCAACVSSKNWIAEPESRQLESHYEKSKTLCLEVQVLNQSAEVP